MFKHKKEEEEKEKEEEKEEKEGGLVVAAFNAIVKFSMALHQKIHKKSNINNNNNNEVEISGDRLREYWVRGVGGMGVLMGEMGVEVLQIVLHHFFVKLVSLYDACFNIDFLCPMLSVYLRFLLLFLLFIFFGLFDFFCFKFLACLLYLFFGFLFNFI